MTVRRACLIAFVVLCFACSDQGATAADKGATLQAKIDKVNREEKHLIQKLQQLQVRERYVQNKLDAVRKRKKYLQSLQAVRPLRTPASPSS